MSERTASQPNTDRSRRRLRVVLDVALSDAAACPLEEIDGEVTAVRHQYTGDDCHADVTVAPACPDDDRSDVMHVATQTTESCLCCVFSDHGCVPEITAVAADTITVETYLADRTTLTDLVADLKAVANTVSLTHLTRLAADDQSGDSHTHVTLDLFKLTDKQREAAAAAVAKGYYATPRGADLSDLATALGISKSAVSQRLSAVESKLATSAFTEAQQSAGSAP
ncbi:dimethyl sulfoxide reductase transcriptional activator DmsR [Halobacterium salinarum]|uniref:dimethyl sulfoxide reductase transcriptional activator DmsR n=1 Tax=Halobacterium salinarum TaxID=2242 RepID=UPI0025556EDA|nr:dimethyl sulfoxide reductase transcriptional activator DmsR [Halobacterium salinarum]MDL0126694.1 dimethyl sulfoxide reductase transcriptional activator DmsR [Halobacterium salinarum]